MTNTDLHHIFKIEDLSNLPDAIMKILFSDERDAVFHQLKKLNPDPSFDWFQNVYENELAQRSQNKQDFTPNAVGMLLSKITGNTAGTIYEPTAGNGSLIIANWWHRKSSLPDYIPEDHPVECWELSSRSIPILLFNLSVRNIQATVYHGNVIEGIMKETYELKPSSQYSIIIKK